MTQNFFNESQIRKIIEKTMQIAQNNNGAIPISKIEDAAALAAYIAGYSSWKEYRKEQKKDLTPKSPLEIEEINEKENNFSIKKIDISPENVNLFKDYFLSLIKQEQLPSLKENNQLLFNIIIGNSYNKLTKASEPRTLLLQNTAFIGNNERFLDNAIFSLEEQKQTIFKFSNKPENAKLDPINEIFVGDYLEDFLAEYSQDHRDFIFIWGLLLKHLYQQYKMKITVDFLIETLSLDFVVKIWYLLSQENSFIGSMLLNYIKSLSNIKQEGFSIAFSKESQEKHWKHVQPLLSKLTIIKDAYDHEVFSYDGELLQSCMINKKSLSFFVPNRGENLIFNLIDFIVHSATVSYLKLVDGLNIKEHSIFIINSNDKLSKTPLENDYIFFFSYFLPFDSSFLQFYEQIVFSKHNSFIEPPETLIKKLYLQTKIITDNIFFNSGASLLSLNNDYGYLWQKENKEAETNFFILSKFSN